MALVQAASRSLADKIRRDNENESIGDDWDRKPAALGNNRRGVMRSRSISSSSSSVDAAGHNPDDSWAPSSLAQEDESDETEESTAQDTPPKRALAKNMSW